MAEDLVAGVLARAVLSIMAIGRTPPVVTANCLIDCAANCSGRARTEPYKPGYVNVPDRRKLDNEECGPRASCRFPTLRVAQLGPLHARRRRHGGQREYNRQLALNSIHFGPYGFVFYGYYSGIMTWFGFFWVARRGSRSNRIRSIHMELDLSPLSRETSNECIQPSTQICIAAHF